MANRFWFDRFAKCSAAAGFASNTSWRSFGISASLSFPYANGGMRGKVTVRDDGIDPQPMTPSVRPPGAPLRAATITGFSTTGVVSKLEYRLGGALYRVDYTIDGASVRFVHTDPSGATRTETFQRRA